MTGAGVALRSGGNALLGRAHAFAISRERAHRSSSSYSCTAKPHTRGEQCIVCPPQVNEKKLVMTQNEMMKSQRQNSTQDQTELYSRSDKTLLKIYQSILDQQTCQRTVQMSSGRAASLPPRSDERAGGQRFYQGPKSLIPNDDPPNTQNLRKSWA